MLSVSAAEDKIRKLIVLKGVSVAEFSRSIGMSDSAIKSILNGITKPSIETLIKISKKYYVTLDWLCTVDGTGGKLQSRRPGTRCANEG